MRIIQSDAYASWSKQLKDRKALARINAKLLQIQKHGQLLGDVKPLRNGIFELRFHFGPGYRVYASLENSCLVLLLLVGGDKSTQKSDIELAIRIAQEWRRQNG